MYKPRRSKYFTLRCEGMVQSVARKYLDARLVYLDDVPESDRKEDDIDFVRIPISAFCVDNSVPRDKLKKGFIFCLYIEKKRNKKRLILEERKFRPRNTKSFRLSVKRKMKEYCKLFHGDNWKEVWEKWKTEDKTLE